MHINFAQSLPLHELWVYKKHPYKKRLVEFSKIKKRRLVNFLSTKKRLASTATLITVKTLRNFNESGVFKT